MSCVTGVSCPRAHFLVACHAFDGSYTGTEALNAITPPGVVRTSTNTLSVCCEVRFVGVVFWFLVFWFARKEKAASEAAAAAATLNCFELLPSASFADAGACAMRRRAAFGGDMRQRSARRVTMNVRTRVLERFSGATKSNPRQNNFHLGDSNVFSCPTASK